jgi:hypothetical protein
MKCTYGCGRGAASQEHPLPAAFGSFKNYPTLNDRICTDCNSKCKILEERVSRGGGEGLFRTLLGIRGRKRNKKANPFYQASAGASRLTVTSEPLSGQPKSALGIDDMDAGAFGELRQVLFILKDGTSRGIPVTADTQPERFKALISDIDLSRVEQVHLYADSRTPPMELRLRFGDEGETVGSISRTSSYRIKIFDDVDSKELKKRRNGAGDLIQRFIYPLSDGMRWISKKAQPLLERERTRLEQEARDRIQGLVGRARGLRTAVRGRIPLTRDAESGIPMSASEGLLSPAIAPLEAIRLIMVGESLTAGCGCR